MNVAEMISDKRAERGVHYSTGKAWARVPGPLGMVEQWADTEIEALNKCIAYIRKHHQEETAK